MSRICLDTSAYSQFRRGDPAAIKTISEARWLGVASVVLGELRTGFLGGRRRERNEDELHAFLSHPSVEVLNVDADASAIYAEIMVALRQAGTPVPTNDLWIAAVAAREGATVVSYDDHFLLIHRVGSKILRANSK